MSNTGWSDCKLTKGTSYFAFVCIIAKLTVLEDRFASIVKFRNLTGVIHKRCILTICKLFLLNWIGIRAP